MFSEEEIHRKSIKVILEPELQSFQATRFGVQRASTGIVLAL